MKYQGLHISHVLHLSDNEDAELDNEEDDSTHSDSDEEGEWKVKKGNRARSSTKQSIPTASNSTQLPAIRFFISTRAIESFKSPIAIAKEINKCMSSNKLKLKFASIKGNILMMATDDRTLQCYKCQKAGHSAWNYTNAQVCLKCSGQHSHKDCNATELKCANCNQSHAACSRQCKELQPPAKSKTNQTINKSYAKVVSNKCDLTATNKSPTLEQAVLEQLKEFVTTSIEAKIKEMTALVIDHISNVLSCFTGNLGVSPGDINKTNNNKMETNNNNNSEILHASIDLDFSPPRSKRRATGCQLIDKSTSTS